MTADELRLLSELLLAYCIHHGSEKNLAPLKTVRKSINCTKAAVSRKES